MYFLYITWGQQTQDYTRYLDQTSVTINEQVSIPTQASFNLIPSSKNFQMPPVMSYVQLYSSKYDRSLFTGFISSGPVKAFMALSQIVPDFEGGHLYQYSISCTSDEYLLNCKAIPFVPAYVNRYQGDILASLANILCPGYFDTTSFIQQGDLVPNFSYSPQQSWCELAKQFGDDSRFRYKVKDKIIYYQPYGDGPFGISYDESDPRKLFSPKDLQTTVLAVPIVNDITIVGNTEAGNNREDYFLGDGFTANDPLLHKVFRGASVILLQDSFNASQLNVQNWYLQDPGDNFDFSAGALNVLQPSGTGLYEQGFSYLSMNNGLELAGGVDLQVGEVTLNDSCEGILGGIYADSLFMASGLIAGFHLTSPNGVVFGSTGVGPIPGAPAIGVSGVFIQAIVTGSFIAPTGTLNSTSPSGVVSGPPASPVGTFLVGPQLMSQINHNYVLLILVHAPQYTRYTQIYRTATGLEYGGRTTETQGSVTFVFQDYDIAAASGFFYTPAVTTYTIANVDFPPFADWALVNNERLNITITNSTVALMPLGGLYALEGPSGLYTPTGLILPMLPVDSGGYIGPIQPWPSPASANILPPPLCLNPGPTVEMLGSGFDLQVAQVSQGNTSDTLAFYAQSTPAAGTPVRFQSWEAQAAMSRLQASGSIVEQQQIVGDDGLRSAIVTNLSPLPRTSEDCDAAGQAYLEDRTAVYYNGTYTCTSLYFNGLTADQQFFPTVGRMMLVNAPRRGIVNQLMKVTNLTITMLEMKEEILQYQIQFGADLYLEKVLFNFVDIQPVNVLAPSDLANPPNPRYTVNVDNSFLPDLNNVQVDLHSIKPGTAAVDVLDPYYGPIEIRRIDSNWGLGPTPDLLAIAQGPRFTLNRPQYDGVWFMRPVQQNPNTISQKDYNGILALASSDPAYISAGTLNFNQWNVYYALYTGVAGPAPQTVGVSDPSAQLTLAQYAEYLENISAWGTSPITSRRSKVLRIRWPQRPASPVVAGTSPIQAVGPGGGTLSTYAIQFFWNGDQRNIYGMEVRAADDQTILVQKPVASLNDLYIDLSQTPMPWLEAPLNTDYNLSAYFFNAQWDYSPPRFLGRLVGLPYLWSPAYAPVSPNDFYVLDDQFGMQIAYELQANGTFIATPIIKGTPPPNQDSQLVDSPLLYVAVAITGGAIPSGIYQVAVAAADGIAQPYNCTDLSDPLTVYVNITGGATIFFSGHYVDGGKYIHAFLSDINVNDGWHFAGAWSAATGTNAITGTIAAYDPFGVGAPDSLMDHFTVSYQKVRHSGVWGGQVYAVSSSSITLAGAYFPANSLTGRYVSTIGRYNIDLDVPVLNLAISGNTDGSGGPGTVLIFSRVHTPDLTAIIGNVDGSASGPRVQIGDVISISMQFTVSALTSVPITSAQPTTVTSPPFAAQSSYSITPAGQALTDAQIIWHGNSAYFAYFGPPSFTFYIITLVQAIEEGYVSEAGGTGSLANYYAGIDIWSSDLCQGLVPGMNLTLAGYTGTAAPMNGSWVVNAVLGGGSGATTTLIQLTATLPLATTASSSAATASYTALQDKFTDPLLINAGNTNGISGLDPTVEPGRVLMIMDGTGVGQSPLQISAISGGISPYTGASGYITIVTAGTWPILPDETSVVIIADAQVTIAQTPTWNVANWDSFSTSIQLPPLQNLAGATWLFRVFTANAAGSYIDNQYVRWRILYVPGAQGTRLISTSQTMLVTDGYVVCDTSQISYNTGTLTSNINAAQSGITGMYASGAVPLNGTYMNIDSETVFIVSGAPSDILTVLRGQLGTAAVPHSSGAMLQIAGALVFTLVPSWEVPNVIIIVGKESPDINYVDVRSATGDIFPNGNTDIILPDNSQARGVTVIKFPGAGAS